MEPTRETGGGGSRLRADPLARLDGLVAASTIAHETIDLLCLELVRRDQAGPGVDQARRDAAQIATELIPKRTEKARALALLLKQAEAAERDPLLIRLGEEVARVEPELRRLLDRQRMIATNLRARLLVAQA